jgi:hypothetical protein
MSEPKTEKGKPRARFTNSAEQIVRILCRLPKSVREPTAAYATALALAEPEPAPEPAPEPRDTNGRKETEHTVLSML